MSHSIGAAPHAASSDVTLIPPQADWPLPRSLRSRALRGSIWTIAGYGTAQILRLASSLILTRLLFPEAFGLTALVGIFMQGLEMFSDVGIGPSIVQNRRGDDQDFLNTAWTIQVVRGLVLWLCSVLIAGPAATFYNAPQLARLMPIAGLGAMIQGFNSTALFTCSRHLAIGRLTLLELGVQAVTVAVMVVLALIRPTVWVIIAGGLVGSFVKMALSHAILSGRSNRFCWESEAKAEILRFGKYIFISTIITFFAMQIDRIFMGKFVSMKELGVYSIALTLATMPRHLIQKLSDSVVFPSIAIISRDSGRFHDNVKLARWTLLLLAGPFCAALAGLANPMIKLLYDTRYASAGTILSLLAGGTWLQTVSVSYGAVILAAGMPKYISFGVSLRMAIFLALMWPAFRHFGVLGVAGVASASELGVLGACLAGAWRLGVISLSRDLLMSLCVAALALAYSAAYSTGSAGSGGDFGGLMFSGVVIILSGVTMIKLFQRKYLFRGEAYEILR